MVDTVLNSCCQMTYNNTKTTQAEAFLMARTTSPELDILDAYAGYIRVSGNQAKMESFYENPTYNVFVLYSTKETTLRKTLQPAPTPYGCLNGLYGHTTPREALAWIASGSRSISMRENKVRQISGVSHSRLNEIVHQKS